MYFHITVIKVLPGNASKAADILGGSLSLDYYRTLQGIQSGLLLESLDEPGKLHSFSIWDTRAAANATFADPNYARLIGELRGLMVAPPERYGHNLLRAEIFQDTSPTEDFFVNNTILTVQPENSQKLISILYRDEMFAWSKTAPGFLRSYAFESLEEPGRIVSMSWWKSSADAQATFSNPVYAELLGAMRPLLIKQPERRGFRVLKVVLFPEQAVT